MKRWQVYAPVIIPTLCRYEHFKRCIESLSRCTGAEYTEVFIGLDFPLKKEHEEGYKKICDFIETVHGFKTLNVYKREKNYGVARNVDDLKERVGEKYDRYIYSEDDNEFSPNFLEYINAGLERYKDNPNVLFICGCTMTWGKGDYYDNCMKTYPWNAFPAKDYNALGTGFWFDKMPDGPGLTKDKVLRSTWLTFKTFCYGYYVAIARMLHQLHKETQLGDVCKRLYCVFNNKYCIFPRVSKVKNWGYDGTGLNSDNNLKLIETQVLDTSSDFILDDFKIKEYTEIKKFNKRLYRNYSLKKKVVIIKKYIIYRITGDNVGVKKKELLKLFVKKYLLRKTY